ncbi:MAG: DNA-binding protein WhiA [Oscillospiraceae bacterium]|nr:DNA-binding protein WhiA [Oscillospiraceae bacterium]
MSFSSDIKKELCAVRELSRNEMAAMLYGMFFAGRTLNNKPIVQTENPDLAAAAAVLAECVFPDEHYETKRLVKNGSSLYTFSIKSRCVTESFGDFSYVNSEIVSGNDADSSAFLRGVFVSCGSVTDPNKEYHLEIVLPENHRSGALRGFIEEHGMSVKSTVRGKNTVLYFKTSGHIEDFLTYIGAGLHALEIMQVKIEKDIRNRANRSVNCDSANLDKTVAASEKSRRDIALIIEKRGLDSLPAELRETAVLRMKNPESSLSELCTLHSSEISRSGLNHRLKKLSAIAESLKDRCE